MNTEGSGVQGEPMPPGKIVPPQGGTGIARARKMNDGKLDRVSDSWQDGCGQATTVFEFDFADLGEYTAALMGRKHKGTLPQTGDLIHPGLVGLICREIRVVSIMGKRCRVEAIYTP